MLSELTPESVPLTSTSGVGTLYPTVCLVDEALLESYTRWFMSTACLVLRWRGRVVTIEAYGLPSLEYLPSGPLEKKFANPCLPYNALLSSNTYYVPGTAEQPLFWFSLINKQTTKKTHKVVISHSQKQEPSKRKVTGKGYFRKGWQGKSVTLAWRPEWRAGVRLMMTGEPRDSMSSTLSSHVPTNKIPFLSPRINICLLPTASKICVNHSLFKQTHTHKLIQYAHLMTIYYMDLLKGKKCVWFKHGITLY